MNTQTEDRKERKIEFLNEQTSCPRCGGGLDIYVESVNKNEVVEEARCPYCNSLSRKEDHTLH